MRLILLLIAAIRGTQGDLFALLASDFTGKNNFIYWLAAMLAIGAIGYIPKAKPVSVALLTLVVLVLFLKKGNADGVGGGFFAQLTSGLATTQTATPAPASSGGMAAAAGTGLLGALSTLAPLTGMIQ